MPQYVYAVEPASTILNDPDLMDEHRDAVPTDSPHFVDNEQYLMIDKLGMLRCITVRYDGELVGYLVAVIQNDRHSKDELTAIIEAIYVQPEHRGNAGRRLMIESDIYFAGIGVKRVLHQVMDNGRDFSPVLQRMGYERLSVTYVKQLD